MRAERNGFSIHNLTHLVSVDVLPEREAWTYKWYPAQYSWLFKRKITEAGFFHYERAWFNDEALRYTIQEIEDDHCRVDMESKIVYRLPTLVLHFTDKSSVAKYFKTWEELKEYLSDLKEEVDMVNLDYITQIK